MMKQRDWKESVKRDMAFPPHQKNAQPPPELAGATYIHIVDAEATH